MKKRLSGPLGSYPDRDEFQIGTMLIWVKYPPGQDRLVCLDRAEKILPILESDIVKAEQLATACVGSSVQATVIGIAIETDGSASYDCTFFDGEHEDTFISIDRASGGGLVPTRT